MQLPETSIDQLTGLKNRKFAKNLIKLKLLELREARIPQFSLILLDIDQFKNINTTLGQDAGDKLLQMFADFLTCELRTKDTIIRWNNDQFLILLNGQLAPARLYDIANRLSFLIQESSFPIKDQRLNITISIGATLAQTDDSLQTLSERVEKLVSSSKSKQSGEISIG